MNHTTTLTLAAAALAIATTLGGCQSKQQGMQRAAEILCEASKLGFDPPEAAYVTFAKRMNTDLANVKKHAKDVVGTEAFVAHATQEAHKLPGSARKAFAEIWGAAAGMNPKRKLEILEEGFAEHGVKLRCPEFKRFMSR